MSAASTVPSKFNSSKETIEELHRLVQNDVNVKNAVISGSEAQIIDAIQGKISATEFEQMTDHLLEYFMNHYDGAEGIWHWRNPKGDTDRVEAQDTIDPDSPD